MVSFLSRKRADAVSYFQILSLIMTGTLPIPCFLTDNSALFGKVLCYVKIIEDQQKRPGTPNPLLPKHLEVIRRSSLLPSLD